jgi:hypothetical protein
MTVIEAKWRQETESVEEMEVEDIGTLEVKVKGR